MTDIQIKFTCGCGFRTTQVAEAAQHTEATGHQQDIAGTVKPEPKKE